MSRPTRAQVHELIERLRTMPWKQLEQRLVEALDADRSGTNLADGFARNASGNGGSGPGAVAVDPDDPDAGSVTLTPTEAAADARIAASVAHDKLRNHLEHAVGFLAEGAACAGALSSRLDAIDQLRTPGVVDVKWCESCTRIGIRRDVAHYGDVGGRLPRPMHLCQVDYNQTYAVGRLPSIEELRHHEQTGRWRVKASA